MTTISTHVASHSGNREVDAPDHRDRLVEGRRSSAEPRPRLVYFFSSTDGLSRRVEGYLDAVLQRRGNHDTFDVIRVDVVRRADLAERFRVAVVPTIVVIESNRVQGRLERPRGNTAIGAFLAQWLLPSQGRG